MTYDEFVTEAERACVKNPFLRRGQAASNALYLLRPDLAAKVTASDLDPFYDDAKVERFYEWLYLNW